MKKYTLLCLLLILSTTLTACQFFNDKNPEEYVQVRRTFFPMTTTLDIVLQVKDEQKANQAIEEAKRVMDRLESMLSVTVETSEVNLINENAGIRPVKVSEETFEVIKKGIHYGEITKGKFDITIAPLLSIYDWREGRETAQRPEQGKIEEAMALVNYKNITLDEENSTVFLTEPSMELELGGIGKGYIIDKAVEVLKEHDMQFGYVNGGGDIRFLGPKADGSQWRIGISNPRGDGNIAVIPSEGGSIVSSGDYERFFITQEGERIHHIIDPHTGTSADFAQSVTIVAENATIADILSTSLFMFPSHESINLAKSLGVDALIVTSEGEIVMTEGMEDLATITQ